VRYGPGTEPAEWVPGDFLLTHSTAWPNRMVRLAQRIALPEVRRFAYWDHCAMVVSREGDLVEAIGGRGVVRTSAVRHLHTEYRLVRVPLEEEGRRAAVRYALRAVEERRRYGWSTIAAGFLAQLTDDRLALLLLGEETCSGLVAQALQSAGVYFDRRPAHVLPADLARSYGVRPPVFDSA
jgi:hypothetical protein